MANKESINNRERKLIAIEGIDRSGKGTVYDKLKVDLRGEVDFGSFPNLNSGYGNMIYDLLKKDLVKYKEVYNFYNSMDKNVIMDSVLGDVICDRFDITQYVYGESLGVEDSISDLRYRSNVIIYIDIPYTESIRRGNSLGDNDLIEDDVELLQRIEQTYKQKLKEVEEEGKSSVYYVDGLQDQETVYEQVYGIIQEELKTTEKEKTKLG